MSEPLKDALRAAVLRLLAPLIKLLLQAGIGAGEFAALAKVAFVRQARELGVSDTPNSKPNVSRIAVLTGLTRVEVNSILAEEESASRGADWGRQRAERVLAGWWNDPDFQTEAGAPALLPATGKSRSFASLCHRYSGALDSAVILKELVRVRAVRRLGDGRVQALSRTYATVRWNPAGIEAVGEQLSEHCATLAHNLTEPSRPLYVRRIVNSQLDPSYAPMLRRDMEQSAETFADSLDDALNDPLHTLTPARREAEGMRLGMVVYLFEEPSGDRAGGPGETGPAPSRPRTGRRQKKSKRSNK